MTSRGHVGKAEVSELFNLFIGGDEGRNSQPFTPRRGLPNLRRNKGWRVSKCALEVSRARQCLTGFRNGRHFSELQDRRPQQRVQGS